MHEWIPLDAVQPGMVLARSVFDPDKRNFLLVQGLTLKDTHITVLKNRGIGKVCIDRKIHREKRTQEMYNKVLDSTRVMLQDVRQGKELFPAEVRRTVDDLLSELIDTNAAMLTLCKFYEHDEHLFSHSLNSSIYGAILAKEMNYSEEKLKKITEGALLHDVGKCKVPKHIIEKKGSLTDAEMILVKDHVIHGYRLLRQAGFGDEVIHMAYEHHERQDGSGYPRGLKESEINEMARIMAIIDIYEALTSERSHRKAYLPHEAAEIIVAQSTSQLDRDLARILLRKVAIYPVGMKVGLNNGMAGTVIGMDEDFPTRPMVATEDGREVNLLNETTLFVDRILTEKTPARTV